MIGFDRAARALPLLLLFALGACASNEGRQAASRQQGDISRLTLAPLAYVAFCLDHERECRPSGPPDAIVALTPETRSLLDSVNHEVNERIRPTTAIGAWRINPPSGNCNDYVVSKRHELLERGLPASALLITVVETEAGEGHLLLTVRTDQGDMILDNLTSEIRPRRQTNFVWLSRQRPSDPTTWEEL